MSIEFNFNKFEQNPAEYQFLLEVSYKNYFKKIFATRIDALVNRVKNIEEKSRLMKKR